MRESFPDGCATALIGAAPNAISASIVLRLFMRTPRVARRQCKPRIQRMERLITASTPKYQANRRAATDVAKHEPRTGGGSCPALVDTWLQATLPLKGNRR